MDPTITKEIIKTSNVLRKKFRALKRGIEDIQDRSEKHLAPIMRPLLDIKQELQKKYTDDKPTKTLEKKSTSKVNLDTPATMWWDDENISTQIPVYEEIQTPSLYRRSTLAGPSTPLLTPSSDQPAQQSPSPQPSEPEVYETEEPLAEKVREYVRTPGGEAELEEHLKTAGNLQRSYLEKLLKGSTKSFDARYGIRVMPDGGLAIGDTTDVALYANSDDISIKGKTYEGTPGLLQLLYLKSPQGYTQDDLKNYKDILISTNAHKKGYSEERALAGNRSEKYRNIIGKLFSTKYLSSISSSSSSYRSLRPRKGLGLMDIDSPIVEYWDDPNELVGRLRFLIASTMSGNNAHYNEIQSILEELREANIIY